MSVQMASGPKLLLDKHTLSQRIKTCALQLGFHKVAIVPASELDTEGDRFREWLARGFHADMQWLERDLGKRLNPEMLLANARSVIVVALNYYTGHEHIDGPNTGKVSRYAWGDDYHDVVGEKLKSLMRWIKEQEPAVNGKVCVDIQRTLDKAWAVRGGLGWIGKHSNLITHEYGSWVFLGELFVDIELEYSNQIIDDHCGTCTLCIDACPTDAIVQPYVVDSNKCISYATIELRDDHMSPEVESEISGWLYGCDICQDVCPWNRFEQTTEEERFAPREGNVNMDLVKVMDLTPETYAHRFRGTAIKRAKLSGLKRNAQVLLKHASD